jgi:histone-lysine N-methyltransferase SETMAR
MAFNCTEANTITKTWFSSQKKFERNLLGAAPENTIIIAISYHTQLEKFESEVVKQGLFNGKILFEHDNAKTNFSKVVLENIAEFCRELLPHPPYCPDLAPSDYHLVCLLNNFIRGKHF